MSDLTKEDSQEDAVVQQSVEEGPALHLDRSWSWFHDLIRSQTFFVASMWFVSVVAVGCDVSLLKAQDSGDLSPEQLAFFEKEVRPLLIKRCSECHGGKNSDGGLSLASADGWRKGGESGPVIVPGKPDESLLIDAINYRSLEMPPADHGGQLPAEEIAILTRWVAQGAPDPRSGSEILGGMTREEAKNWWAFQPLPKLLPTEHHLDVQHIDRLLQEELDRQGLIATSPTDRRTLIRRLSYNLTGLPPSAADVDQFISDTSADAYLKLIDRLLASREYGEHWGRHWLDVVRYADTAGENTDRPLPHAWRYRNWVIDSFNQDLPFDQLIRQQIAGDLLDEMPDGQSRAEGIVATGYLAIARRFGHDIDKDMYLTYEDVIDNLGKNFLGLTLGCARCHDHKYDPISAEDYYALYGIFESTKFAFPGCEPKGQPRDLVPLLTSADVQVLLKPWQEKVALFEAAKRTLDSEVEAARRKIADPWANSQVKLAQATLAEGGSASFQHKLTVRSGEVLLLSVSPNENYGADSTLVDWTIRESGQEQRSWSLVDLVPDLLSGNPRSDRGAVWSFLDVADGPRFLTDRRESNGGRTELKSWSIGSEPSVFVNSSADPINVWTMLPPKSFLVHPGDRRPVAVAWTSPVDGEIVISGRVADAHPAEGLDGVSFELSFLPTVEMGPNLLDLGSVVTRLPEPGPAPNVPVAYAVVDQAPTNAKIHERGDPEKLGPEVPRRWLSVFGGAEVATGPGSGRRELAEWIAQHPLAARVMVNRIWEWHFGRGLVRTANDFGARGEAPTHSELLDFLAVRFVQSGYSIRAMHRLILQTEAYQRSSLTPSASDPENRWLAHFSRRRLTAEELRDSLLLVSGQLDRTTPESHPFPAEETWTFTQHGPFNAVYETNRRSVYLMVQRQRRHPFLALFDGADPNASTPTRQATIVPTQALYFMNDAFFHQQAEGLATRVAGVAADSDTWNEGQWIRDVWRDLFQREPTEVEVSRAKRFLADYPAELPEKRAAQVRVLMSTNEFLFVD